MNIIKRIFQSSIGKKYVVAITGGMLVTFVVVHLLGNLQIFLGRENLNAYAALLKGNRFMLWSFRIGLGTIGLIHVITALLLYFENRAARPVPYAVGEAPYASLASRTMIWSGLVLLGFVIFHLLHLTIGVIQPAIMTYEDHGRHDVYRMVLQGFSQGGVGVAYWVCMAFLYLHLSHGISSLFQSLGFKNRQYGDFILGFSQGAALLLFLGNCSIPLAVLMGWLRFIP